MNKEEFASLVLESTDSLYRVAKAILRQDADCEDAISEAVTIGFQKLHKLRQDEYARTWLTRILINECRRIMRKRQMVMEPSEMVRMTGREREDYDSLYDAIYCLGEKHRIVIVLYYLEGYSVSEIAQMVKTTEGTVKSRLSRAREALKNMLREEYAHGLF